MVYSDPSEMTLTQIYKMQIPDIKPPIQTAFQYYDLMIENDIYPNFMIIFGYPFVINVATTKRGNNIFT